MKPAGDRLQITNAQQVSRPVPVAVNVAEHDRGRGTQSGFVRRAHDLEPSIGPDLVGAKRDPNLIVEDFSSRAWQRCQAPRP